MHRSAPPLALVAAIACGSSTTTKPDTLGNTKAAEVGGSVQLTWTVGEPSVPHKVYHDELLRPVTLEVTTNGVTKPIKLEPQMGALYPYNQVVCKTDAYPLVPGEVAKLTFYEGGAGGYAVKRELEDTLAVILWSLTDGACEGPSGEPTSCPRFEKPVTTFQVPVGAIVSEAIVEVDATGGRTPFSCAELQ